MQHESHPVHHGHAHHHHDAHHAMHGDVPPPHNERRVWLVVALTTLMMSVEIVAGHVFGSMALVADGWHMATHAAALLLAALAYRFARRHAGNTRFAWGTGKVGDLAGFASAVALALIALIIGGESAMRLLAPVPIDFGQAMMVAALGLVLNLVCAWMLGDGHHHHHHHEHDDAHDHDDDDDHAHTDHNLRAAYVHVLADALTSVLAIVALVAGRVWGWTWADPVMGMVGAVVVARWSWALMGHTAAVLLDATGHGAKLRGQIAQKLQENKIKIHELRVWQIATGHFAAEICVSPIQSSADTAAQCHATLAAWPEIAHVRVEVAAT